MEDSELLFDSDEELYAIATASNIGLGVGRIQVDGFLQGVENWDWSETNAILEIEELEINSPNNQIIGLGVAGIGNVFEIRYSGISRRELVGNRLTDGMHHFYQAKTTDIEHGLANGNLTLFVATDRGLLIAETNSGRDGDSADWRFYYSREDTGIFVSINELRTLPAGSDENPAEIRDIHLDGPSPDNPQVLWFGTLRDFTR